VGLLPDQAAHQFQRWTIPQEERAEELLAPGAEANQSMQPRPVRTDDVQISYARRETVPYPLVQPQVKADRRLSEDPEARHLRQDWIIHLVVYQNEIL
jgi:hypothetical protein